MNSETLTRLEEERERVARDILAMRKGRPVDGTPEEIYARLSRVMKQIGDANERQAEEVEKEEIMSKKQSAEKSKRAAKGKAAKPATSPVVAPKPAPAPKPQKPPEQATVAPTAPQPAKGKGKAALAAKGRTLAPDPRLPAPGTVLKKTDRHGAVRCECKVEEGGIRYAGKLYSSISGAALAASQDLGLKGSTVDGYHFWGLSKPPRPSGDPVEALERAWDRYRDRAEAIAKEKLEEDVRKKLVGVMAKHATAVEKLAGALK